MKKVIIIILLSVMLTGCTMVRIDTKSVDNILSVVLSKNNDLYNRVGKGYKYYVPRGITYIDTTGLNEKLYNDGVYYYLYVDAISYYYKKEVDYKTKEDVYYSSYLKNGDKEGYLEIKKNEQTDKYYIQFMYNYAKIEAMVDEEDIEVVILNSSYILSTVKFNDDVIKLTLDDDYFTNQEEKYDIFTIKKDTGNFVEISPEEDLEN